MEQAGSGEQSVAREAGRTVEDRSLDDVADEIMGLASQLAAATCRWLELVAEFDRREGWLPTGCHSAAHWLSWKCGIAVQTAREQVRVARALEGLPLVRAEFARGSLSYTKVRALVRMCTPDTEADLVELAKVATGEHLKRIAAGYARATRGPHEQRPSQSVRWHWDDDGHLRLSATLDPESGRAFLAAMHRAARQLVPDAHAETDADVAPDADGDADAGYAAAAACEVPPHQRLDATELRQAGLVAAFDAMVQLALAAAADESMSPPPADLVVAVAIEDLAADETSEASDPTRQQRRQRERRELRRHGGLGRARPRPRHRLRAPGRPLDPCVAQRLSCDATLAVLLHDHRGSPLDLGRRQRSVNHALRTALALRDGGCRFPGCGHTRFVHAHHVVHWAHGGPTSIDNLLTLCAFHHRVVHDHGLTIAYSLDGTLQFVDARGRVVAEDRVGAPRSSRHRSGRRAGALPAATGSIEPTWGGERLDLGLAIDALVSAESVADRRAQRAAAAA